MDDARRPAERPALTTYEDLAGRIELVLTSPALSEDDVRDRCSSAAALGIHSAAVRPCDVDIAIRALRGTSVLVASVAGFPYGFSTTATKLYEARDLLRRGVREIEISVNHGKLVSRQFSYLETELIQTANACHAESAALHSAFDFGALSADLRIIACRLTRRTECDFFAAVSPSGGATPASDLRFLHERLAGPSPVGLKAAARSNLEAVLEAYEAGADHIAVDDPEPVLAAWRQRISEAATAAANKTS